MNSEYNLTIDFQPQKEWSVAPMWLEMSFGAIGGGMFIVSAFMNSFIGMVVSYLILVALKGIFLLADLGNPTRFLWVFARPFKSWLSFGAWLFMLFSFFGFILLAPTVLGMDLGSRLALFLKTVTIVLALSLTLYEGFLLGSAVGIDAWNSGILPILFGTSALAAGSGGVTAIMGFMGKVQSISFNSVNTALIITLGVLLFSYVINLRGSSIGSRKSAENLLKELPGAFIGGAVIVGIVIPLCVVGLVSLGYVVPTIALSAAGVLEALGSIFLRYSILKAGVYSPII